MTNGYGIDMGTGNLKIYSRASDTVTLQKNTIAIVEGNQMYAYGDEAYSMYEKAPENIEVSFPIVGGVIADFDNMQTMLLEVLAKNIDAKLKGSDIVIAVPTDITEVEKKAFYDMFAKTRIKAKSIRLCEKPLADALGLGIDITEPTGVMVVDMGCDTTEISVISLGGLVLSELLPYGGNNLDDSIVTYMKRRYNLVIGRKTAKMLKEKIGRAVEAEEGATPENITIVGRDIVSGLPIEMEISDEIIYQSIKDDLANIGSSIRMILEKVPPELAKDIVHSGIYITGGSSQIVGLGDLFKSMTNIDMIVSDEGEKTVALGLGKVLSEDRFDRFGYTMKSRIFS
ncbi:MAG TPA: rod shape-determining protein [Lachnospiraceae bacterium]|jgi:rod shape-determining protein MreB|nr:rod shape-determining protein [Lachnospiraceae bacterium]MDD7664957.1 rod shape-determining protein [Lachnospiraceae bacterium]MDY4164373.1 rod shape-determining protein [Lachnospiraceae bacterium]HAP03672.1 rod shape-determining protein [Lachnospiraceae bacterium]